MLTGKEDLLRVLIEVYLMEKGTMAFYLQAADEAMTLEVKTTFKELSGFEREHMDFIQFLYQSILGERDIKSFEEFKRQTPAPITEAGIPVKDLEAETEGYGFQNEDEALTLALNIEGKSYTLYNKLSEEVMDTNTQVIFKEMMQQESKHIDYLKAAKTKLYKGG
ncbi:MAG: hypothetical protein HY756_10865 [Nitrospirae bacterium]|nr:hypothetical protein [Nitrospirota bacterium]